MVAHIEQIFMYRRAQHSCLLSIADNSKHALHTRSTSPHRPRHLLMRINRQLIHSISSLPLRHVPTVLLSWSSLFQALALLLLLSVRPFNWPPVITTGKYVTIQWCPIPGGHLRYCSVAVVVLQQSDIVQRTCLKHCCIESCSPSSLIATTEKKGKPVNWTCRQQPGKGWKMIAFRKR